MFQPGHPIALNAVTIVTPLSNLGTLGRPRLTASWSAAGQILSQWEGDSILQPVGALGEAWRDVDEAASPYTVAPVETQRFYRLRKR